MHSPIIRFGGALAAVILAVACAGAPMQVRPAPNIPATITERGDPVYVGTVYPLTGDGTPAFVYERRVQAHDGLLTSTHVTRDVKGSIAIVEAATHSPDYALVEYELYANQLGQSGKIRVNGDQLSFSVNDQGTTRSGVETVEQPVVTGPTLVGYIVQHLDDLRRGKTLGVRFAVLDRLETLGFDLASVESSPGQTRVELSPSSFFVSLAMDPIYFTFETTTGKLVRIEGRVPPKMLVDGSWKDLDARVEYRFTADRYR